MKIWKIKIFASNNFIQNKIIIQGKNYKEDIKLFKKYLEEFIQSINLIDIILKVNSDFILVGKKLNFGICIEVTEYHHEFCVWGIKYKK